MDAPKRVSPQAGPQEAFLSSQADIAIYGGAAGGGKSYALLIEPLRHLNNGEFGAVIFRRTTKQVRNEGGLWDESMKIYSQFAKEPPKESTLEWKFPSGMRVQFAHLEHEKNVFDWQGSQLAFIGYDELTHFEEAQFWYMFSRNRSTSGVPGYIRAGCNPDKNSWVRDFIAWWIGEDGYAIPERSGVLRWFIRVNDKVIWADSPEELKTEYGEHVLPKSVTFIPSKLEDNKILMDADPSYAANLDALPRVERMRLKDGNWDVQPAAGMYFKKTQFEIVDVAPAGCEAVRYWDRAATEVSDKNKNPDYTAGVLLLKDRNNVFYIADVTRFRASPLKVEQAVYNTAVQDGIATTIYIEQDPGSAGVADANNYTRLLSGFVVKINRPTTDKITRSLPVSAQVEAGNIKLVRGVWNKDFLTEVENFPEDAHDDQVDALSGAFNMFGSVKVGSFAENKKTEQQRPFAGSIGAKKQW